MFRLSLCLFSVKFPGCLELFFQLLCWASWVALHLSLWEFSPWVGVCLCGPASHLATTRTIWSKWTQTWWSFELVLRILAFKNKDQSPPPYHLENLLIWVQLIKVVTFGFAQYVLWAPRRIPQLIPATLIIPFNKVIVQLIIYVHFVFLYCVWYSTLCTYALAFTVFMLRVIWPNIHYPID